MKSRLLSFLSPIKQIVPVISLPNNKHLDWFTLKEFTDGKINEAKKIEICFGKGRKHGGKRKNACYQHFLLFPQPAWWPNGYIVCLVSRGHGCNPWLQQTKVFKIGSSGSLPWRSGLWD